MLDADEFTMGKVVSAEIYTNGDEDWYTFTLTEPTKLNFVLQSSGTNWYDVKFIDEQNDYNELWKTKLGSATQTLYFTAGTYYIGLVSNFGSAYISGIDYEFKMTATPCNLSFEGNGENNALGDAAAVEFDTEYNAQISQNDTIDYYTIDLPNDARVTFNFSGSLDAADWSLYDNEDDLIKHGTYQKDNANDSKITKRNSLVLKAGKYTLSVAKNDKIESYGPYTFSFDYLENYNDTSVNGIIAFGDLNKDGMIDAKDATITLTYYSYLSTGGTETDMNKWIEEKFGFAE